MSGFLSNNLYLLIAFLSVLWSVFSTFHDPTIEKTQYEFAQKDNLLKTKDINEVELRQLPKYRLEIDSKIRRSATGTAFYIGDNKWLTARHVINKCPQVFLEQNSTKQLIERIIIHPNSDLAIFDHSPNSLTGKFGLARDVSTASFSSGYPGGYPGDVALSFVGFTAMEERGYNILEKHTVFAISDKEPEHLVSFGGISGGPSFDSFGNVNGVVVAESVRRGLLFAVSIEQISWLIAASNKGSVSPKYTKDKKGGNLSISLDSSSFSEVGEELRSNGIVSKVFCKV